MPLASIRRFRAHSVSAGGFAIGVGVWLACSAPDPSQLYAPLSPGGSGGATAGGAAGTAGSSGAIASGGFGGSGGFSAEGQGGSLSLAGSAGKLGGDTSEVDASVVQDAGALDAGGIEDAAPPPPACEGLADETCDGLDNDCDGVADPGATCPNDCAGFALAGHGYMWCPEAVNRTVALARCEAQAMKLAWIEGAEENDAVVLVIATLDVPADEELLTQIGASDSDDEDDWRWMGNGASPDGFFFWEGNSADDGGIAVDGFYENWATDEPNDDDGEDCGVMSVFGSDSRDPGQWDDRSCDEELPFLCEVP